MKSDAIAVRHASPQRRRVRVSASGPRNSLRIADALEFPPWVPIADRNCGRARRRAAGGAGAHGRGEGLGGHGRRVLR
jgi:hypothetical protein